jgi:hypothetical protein
LLYGVIENRIASGVGKIPNDNHVLFGKLGSSSARVIKIACRRENSDQQGSRNKNLAWLPASFGNFGGFAALEDGAAAGTESDAGTGWTTGCAPTLESDLLGQNQ